MPEKDKILNIGPVGPFSEPPASNRERSAFKWKINTVIDPKESVMTGLANRKWRDLWEHKGKVSGINNTDVPLQQEHPSLFLLPFAPEVMGSGLGMGILKTLGGYAGSYAGSKIGNEVGYALDNAFNKRLFEPLGEVVGGFAGFGKGYNLFGKAGMQGALKYLSKTGKDVPRWFMRPELRTNVGRVNQRTLFAEDQTPKYNSNQITNGDRTIYQVPKVYQGLYPRLAVASDFSGVENVELGNFGYNGQKPNLGLRKLKTEQRSKQLLDSVAEEEKRNASAINWTEKNWNNLTPTEQYWLKTNHGNEWNDKSIIQRMNINNK